MFATCACDARICWNNMSASSKPKSIGNGKSIAPIAGRRCKSWSSIRPRPSVTSSASIRIGNGSTKASRIASATWSGTKNCAGRWKWCRARFKVFWREHCGRHAARDRQDWSPGERDDRKLRRTLPPLRRHAIRKILRNTKLSATHGGMKCLPTRPKTIRLARLVQCSSSGRNAKG